MEQDAPPVLDASTRAALQKLADIAVPQPVSRMPQTWGWAALAILLLLAALFGLWRWHRYREANRYRREALAELAAIEPRLSDGTVRSQALTTIAELIKRTALAAWPRPQVAALSGDDWVAFLRTSAAGTGFPNEAAVLLDDREYRSALDGFSEVDARTFAAAARRWIEAHHVSA